MPEKIGFRDQLADDLRGIEDHEERREAAKSEKGTHRYKKAEEGHRTEAAGHREEVRLKKAREYWEAQLPDHQAKLAAIEANEEGVVKSIKYLETESIELRRKIKKESKKELPGIDPGIIGDGVKRGFDEKGRVIRETDIRVKRPIGLGGGDVEYEYNTLSYEYNDRGDVVAKKFNEHLERPKIPAHQGPDGEWTGEGYDETAPSERNTITLFERDDEGGILQEASFEYRRDRETNKWGYELTSWKKYRPVHAEDEEGDEKIEYESPLKGTWDV